MADNTRTRDYQSQGLPRPAARGPKHELLTATAHNTLRMTPNETNQEHGRVGGTTTCECSLTERSWRMKRETRGGGPEYHANCAW